jgi:AcrR family transcriptional regulator
VEDRTATRPLTTAPPPRVSKAQRERRQRVIEATIELARAGGADAVQMREVADTSGVSLGTVYTYFQSRDNLLYKAMLDWLDGLPPAARSQAPEGESPLDEVERVTRLYLAEPGLLNAWVRSTLTSDVSVIDLRGDVDWDRSLDQLPVLKKALGDRPGRAAVLLNQVFYAATVRWAFGQLDDHDVIDQMRDVVEILLAAH